MAAAAAPTGCAPVNLESQRFVRGYYTIAGVYTLAAALIWGVNTLFLLDAGLSFAELFVANAAYSAGTVVFEIPTGVVADTLGRRTSFLLSAVVLAAGTLGYVLLARMGAGVGGFVAVSVVMGLGFTFYSGATEAWLVDGVRALGYEDDLDAVFARAQMITGAAMVIGTVGGGVLGSLDLAWPFVGRAGLLLVAFVVAHRVMHDTGFTPRPLSASTVASELAHSARHGVRAGWRQPGLRLVMAAGFVQIGFLSWAFYAWQPYLLDLLGTDAVWAAGLISALFALASIGGNQIVNWVTQFCGRRTTLLLWSTAVTAVAAVVVGATPSAAVAMAGLALVHASMGLSWPVRQAYVHHVVPSERRATVISLDAMVSGLGGIGGQAGLGAYGQGQSIAAGYVLGGAVSLVAAPILLGVRRLGGLADRFVGPQAGARRGCAYVPPIASVDATAAAAAVPGS